MTIFELTFRDDLRLQFVFPGKDEEQFMFDIGRVIKEKGHEFFDWHETTKKGNWVRVQDWLEFIGIHLIRIGYEKPSYSRGMRFDGSDFVDENDDIKDFLPESIIQKCKEHNDIIRDSF